MNRMILSMGLSFLIACGGSIEVSTPNADCGAPVTADAASPPDAGNLPPDAASPATDASAPTLDASMPPDAGRYCGVKGSFVTTTLLIDAITPIQVAIRVNGDTFIEGFIYGCGFTDVQTVEFDVQNTSFVVIDDGTIRFVYVTRAGQYTSFPQDVKVDVIKQGADIAQTSILFVADPKESK